MPTTIRHTSTPPTPTPLSQSVNMSQIFDLKVWRPLWAEESESVSGEICHFISHSFVPLIIKERRMRGKTTADIVILVPYWMSLSDWLHVHLIYSFICEQILNTEN